MKGSVEFGAKQAVHNCVGVKPGENVLIITDLASRRIASALRTEAEKIDDVVVDYFVMEDFGERPDDGSNPLEFPDELVEFFKAADASFYAAYSKDGELQSFRLPMLDLVEENEKLRHAHMPGVNEQIMSMGMSADYKEVKRITNRVADLLKGAIEINVISEAGTKLNAQFASDHKWIKCNGVIIPEKWSNLPDGEVYSCPLNASGNLVIDGVLGDYFGERYGHLHDTPVTYTIKRGVVTDIHSENPNLVHDLEEYMSKDDNAGRVGEFAIGTNTGIDILIGNMLQDEKSVGFHLATGSPYPDKTGADWNSDVHLDGVVRNPTIMLYYGGDDAVLIMEKGKFTDKVLD